MVDAPDMFLVQSADIAGQPLFFYGANLLQQNEGRLRQPVPSSEVIVGRQFGLNICLAGNGGDNNSWAVLVAHVVLDDNNGPVAFLLRSDSDA